MQLLSDMIAIPSVNPGETDPGEIHAELGMARYLRDYFERQPYPDSIFFEEVLPNRPNVVVQVGKNAEKPTLLLETHTDTVGVDMMTIEPFVPELRGNRLYGRGATDAKGQLTAMIVGLEMAWEQSGGQLPTNVVLAATADEEHLHRGIDRLIEQKWKADGAIVGEPSELRVIVATKGSIRFQIRTTGVPAHSSSPRDGKNAIYLMAKVIRIIEEKIAPMIEQRTDPLCGYAAASVTLISGGRQVNIIPESCVIDVDRRLLPGEHWENAYNEIKETVFDHLSPEEQTRVRFEYPYLIDPALADGPNAVMSRALSGELQKLGLDGTPVGASFGTDASKIALADIPVVVFGPGSIRQAHTKDEYIDVEELLKAAEVYRNVILHFDQYIGSSGDGS